MPKKLLQQEFIDRANIIHNNKFSYAKVDYVNASQNIIISCPEHGDFNTIPGNHLHLKSGCPKCYGKLRRTLSEFIAQSKAVHGDLYDYDNVKYINDYTMVDISCKIHGKFSPTPTNHIHKKSGCPKCSKERMRRALSMGTDDFIKKSVSVHGTKYDYSLVDYINNHSKVIIICHNHGKFEQQPNIHTDQKCGCPKCNTSKGEEKVSAWLTSNSIIFKPQHKFDDCVDKSKLIFDFYVPDRKILIEFNGVQHYRFIEAWHRNEQGFNDSKRRDAIKVSYAKNKGLQLLTIPYNKNITVMLEKFFNVD